MKKQIVSALAVVIALCNTPAVYAQDDGTQPEETPAAEPEKTEEPVVLTGWWEKEDGYYFYNEDGTMYTGWLDDNGKTYYLDPDTGVMCAGVQKTISGTTYTFDKYGHIFGKGWCNCGNGNWLYVQETGAAYTGWMRWGNTWYYLDPSHAGYMSHNEFVFYKGYKYYLDENGAMATGWYRKDGIWYLFTNNGMMREGWQLVNNTWYYMEKGTGKMLTGMQNIGGKRYYLYTSGAMATGWVKVENNWYYFGSDGAMRTGWFLWGNTWYYLEPESGKMLTGPQTIEGKGYYLTSSGAMVTKWNKTEDGWYYYGNDGAKRTGWIKDGGLWYYLDPESGVMKTGEQVIGGKTYMMNGSGAMLTNWSLRNGVWFYYGPDGAMREGWQRIDGAWYYFYYENDANGGIHGAMAVNTTIEGYKIHENGVYSKAYDYAENVLNTVGWDLKAAYDWCTKLDYIKQVEDPSLGSEWYAVYAFENKSGNCYAYAAAFYYLADLLGYDVHQVHGEVPYRNGTMGPHSWCEIDVDGHTYVFDPQFEWEEKKNGYWFNYRDKGTWRYTNVTRMN